MIVDEFTSVLDRTAARELAKNLQAFLAERAKHVEGATVISLLLDLAKAYERIPHQLLIERALAVGYPVAMLRLHLWLFAGLRRLTSCGLRELEHRS